MNRAVRDIYDTRWPSTPIPIKMPCLFLASLDRTDRIDHNRSKRVPLGYQV